jgi:hypothetical protein
MKQTKWRRWSLRDLELTFFDPNESIYFDLLRMSISTQTTANLLLDDHVKSLQFQAPAAANPALLPIYSGFIYVTNAINGQTVHLSCKNSFLSVHFKCQFMNMYALRL